MEEETKIHKIVPADKMFILAAVLVVSIVGFLILKTIYNFQTLPQNFPQDISVTGEGKAYVRPDIALVNLGVNTQGLKSQDVVNKNNEIMNKVINSIKELGVEDKDIQTTLYNLNPIYDYSDKGQRVFRGYSLEQQIRVKIRNFDKISDILDKTTSNGANTVGDLQFTVDDMEKVRSEARAKAIDQAKEKVLTLVNQAGLKIVKLVNISEGCGPIPVPCGGGFAGAALRESVPPQIEPGQLEVSTSVTLTYRVK